MSNIINDLKRLERAGSKNSRATQKLHESVAEVADRICRSCPNMVELPRGYHIDGGSEDYLYNAYDTGIDLPGDRTRESSMQFAADIAEGLLGEIADFLERRKSESIIKKREMVAASEA